MTNYINPHVRHDGAKQIIVPDRRAPFQVYEAPVDDGLYARSNGDWVLMELGQLSDVSLGSPAVGDRLVYDGTAWVTEPLEDNIWVIQDSDLTSPFVLRNSSIYEGSVRRDGNTCVLQLHLTAASSFATAATILGVGVIPTWARPPKTVIVSVTGNVTASTNQFPNGEVASDGRLRIHDFASTASTSALKIFGVWGVD